MIRAVVALVFVVLASAQAQEGILIAKAECRLFYASGGELVKEYDCATGRGMCSPVGTYTIEHKCHNGGWSYRKGDWVHVGGARIPALGAFWMGLTARSGRGTPYGIHGTTQPELIGQLVSAGCIRMRNRDVDELYGMVPTGTRVTLVNYLGEGQEWLARLTARQLAYASNADGDYDIYLVSSDSKGREQLTDLPGDERTPVFSPDGSRVAFIHHGEDGAALAVIDAAGGPALFVNGAPAGQCLGWIDAGVVLQTTEGETVVCDMDSGEATPVEWTSAMEITPDGKSVRLPRARGRVTAIPASAIRPKLIADPDFADPAISSDGRALAFSVREGKGRAIFACRNDGAALRRVVPADADAVEPSWSPVLTHGPGVTLITVETDPPGLEVLVRPHTSKTAYFKGFSPVEIPLSSATDAPKTYEVIARSEEGEATEEVQIARGQRKGIRLEVRRHGSFLPAVRRFLTGDSIGE